MSTNKSRIWRSVAALAVAGGVPLAGAAGAVAAPAGSAPEVSHLHPHVDVDKGNPDVAYVKAKYRCTSAIPAHLWVSVKQGGNGDLTSESSSQIATAWYDSHPGEDQGTAGPVCNGKWQTDTFKVTRHAAVTQEEAGFEHPAWDRLTSGDAYVQFCLYTTEGSVSFNEFKPVHVKG